MKKEEYINIFIDKEYPNFINKYIKTKTLCRLKYITQFCGCDYCSLYSPKFIYTRYDHSIVVAHMTWHFTHNKKETIAALLHDIGTPAFSHVIDYVMGDYINQESSEIKLSDIIKNDKDLIELLDRDGFNIYDFDDFSKYNILENKKPKLCTDRLDGVLGTAYIWIHKNKLEEIKEVYNDLTVLINEENVKEIGFKTLSIANKFCEMVYDYAMELQGNKDKYIMQYIADVIKKAINQKLFNTDYLYTCKEEDIINLFRNNFNSWNIFENITTICNSDNKPNCYYISFDTKKRNTIPLINYQNRVCRIDNVSNYAKDLYINYNNFKASKYAYAKDIIDI